MRNHQHPAALIRFLLCLAILFSSASCDRKNAPRGSGGQEPSDARRVGEAMDAAISGYVSSLPESVWISQIFLVNVEGDERYSAVESASSLGGGEDAPLVPGGVLLFSYNISKDPLRTAEYIRSIRDFYLRSGNVPPYIAVDQEGGDVNRLRSLTSVLWSQKKVAESFSHEGAAELYGAQARQMRNLGFQMNLAPVVEVENEANREFLGTRTFGTVEDIGAYGKIAVTSYEDAGVASVLKHFPGNSGTDPHTGLPEITVTKSQLEADYIAPFRELSPLSSAVLMSHARVTVTDDDGFAGAGTPACLSRYWVTDILRGELGFDGLVLSDDIFMGALARNGFPPDVAAVSAIEAGVDVIMLSEKRFGSVAGILLERAGEDENFRAELRRAVTNVIRFKIKAGILEIGGVAPAEVGGLAGAGKPQRDEEVPEFTVRVRPDSVEFDLGRFNEDYKAGMRAFDLGK